MLDLKESSHEVYRLML